MLYHGSHARLLPFMHKIYQVLELIQKEEEMAEILNSANVSYTFAGAGSQTEVSSNVTQTNVTYSSSIEITKMALADGFVPGENLSFMLRITNTGSDALSNIVVTDNLGVGSDPSREEIVPMEYVVGSAAQSDNHEPWTSVTPSATSPLTFEISSMNAGDVVEITYTTQVLGSFSYSTISSTATATADGVGGSVTDSAENTLSEASYAHIVATKSGSADNIQTGEPFTYTIDLTNTGNEDATGIVVTDNIPEDFVLTSINMIQNGSSTTLDATDYTLEGGLLTIPSSESTLSLVVAPQGSSANDGLSFELVGSFVN